MRRGEEATRRHIYTYLHYSLFSNTLFYIVAASLHSSNANLSEEDDGAFHFSIYEIVMSGG